MTYININVISDRMNISRNILQNSEKSEKLFYYNAKEILESFPQCKNIFIQTSLSLLRNSKRFRS